MNQMKYKFFSLLLILCLLLSGCGMEAAPPELSEASSLSAASAVETGDLLSYTGSPYVEFNGNVPEFDQELLEHPGYEYYAELDQLGRCGIALAYLTPELMPTEERQSISHIYPSGWNQAEYDFVDGKMLYNRCHLIGFQLAGENANEKNLITGTRYFNVEGMLPFENQVADYIRQTGGSVLYRVSPLYQGSELVARGVFMEAWSVEDQGESVSFNVFVYNVQPGVTINYLTGESAAEGEALPTAAGTGEYVVNKSSKKFHLPECSGVQSMSGENRWDYSGSRENLIEMGYDPCGNCDP